MFVESYLGDALSCIYGVYVKFLDNTHLHKAYACIAGMVTKTIYVNIMEDKSLSLLWWEGWDPVNRFTHSSLVAIITPVGHAKVGCNCCIIEVLMAFLCCTVAFCRWMLRLWHTAELDLFLFSSFSKCYSWFRWQPHKNSLATNKMMTSKSVVDVAESEMHAQPKYCKRGYFRWGKMSGHCWQDIARGLIFNILTPISVIKKIGFYFARGVISAKKPKRLNAIITPRDHFHVYSNN